MLYKNLEENIIRIKKDTKYAQDFKYKEMTISNHNICLIYNETICSSDKIDNFILKNLTFLIDQNIKEELNTFLINFLPSENINKIDSFKNTYNYLHNGFLVILFDKKKTGLAIETRRNLNRSITESQVEKAINGPKDSFVEDYNTNLGLIRKRIKSNDLVIKEQIIGTKTKTKVSLLYMDNLVEQKLIDNVKEQLNKIETDSILDVSYIRNFISKNNYLFPMTGTTEKPSTATMNLLEGRIIILADYSPFVLIIPTFFIDFFHSPEDYYQKPKNITITRIIRFIAFLVSILTPAFYIAVTTYNHETLPSELLINLTAQRSGVPFPAFVEAILMIITFEILRESDIRLPSQMGSAISILGGIILGDAAVAAGIVSPIMVIVIAITSISSLIFSNLDIINAIRIWRIIFMIFASFFGLVGLYMCGYLFVTILASYKSFGKPYLYPLAPTNFRLLKDSFIKMKGNNRNEKYPILIKNKVSK